MEIIPLFSPESAWRPPASLPNLSRQLVVGLDTETKDPNLLKMGPGFLRGDAELKGFSISTDTKAWFFPLWYPQDNYHDPDAALAWLKDICENPKITKIFHNALYDIESLDSVGIEVRGRIIDTQVVESLLEEVQSVSLDNTAKRRLGSQKDESLLLDAAAAYSIDPKGEMYKLPARFVGPYAEQDALLLPRIYEKQRAIIDQYGMGQLARMECELLTPVWLMRKQGVRVDLEKAHELDKQWESFEKEYRLYIDRESGFSVDIWGSKSLVRLCETLGIEYRRTPKGNPSFENDWFENSTNPVLEAVASARRYNKMRRDFLEGQIFKYEVNGRIHGQYHTTRKDEAGTRSGRFSSSNPNLQQVPARDPDFGPKIRGLYLPDDGASWGKFDYSSQEPRITLHFAFLHGIRGAAEFVERYRENPRFCQHSHAANVLGTERGDTKGINLGITYGMGIDKMARQLGRSTEDTQALKQAYNRALPFVARVARLYSDMAEMQGYSQTVLGRRSWFPNKELCYKALNRAVQGSGADLMKKAIIEVYKELDVVPLLTVHDETDYNIYEEDHADQIAEIMENAIEMSVPQVVEPEIGAHWGDVK